MIYQLLYFLFGGDHGRIDRAALWTGVATIAATIAIFIAYFELDSTRKTSRADFAKRFIDTFFTKETRNLFTLLMNSALEFDVLKIKDKNGEEIDHLPYLKIKKDIASQLRGIVEADPNKTGYSAFEIDDLLLGFFDDIGWYEKRGLIEVETIRQTCGYYIIESYSSEEIKSYLNHEDNKGRYKDFRTIAEKLKEGDSTSA